MQTLGAPVLLCTHCTGGRVEAREVASRPNALTRDDMEGQDERSHHTLLEKPNSQARG